MERHRLWLPEHSSSSLIVGYAHCDLNECAVDDAARDFVHPVHLPQTLTFMATDFRPIHKGYVNVIDRTQLKNETLVDPFARNRHLLSEPDNAVEIPHFCPFPLSRQAHDAPRTVVVR